MTADKVQLLRNPDVQPTDEVLAKALGEAYIAFTNFSKELEKSFRGKGIGSKVVAKLIERARELGYQELEIEDIYSWNIGSQKLLTRLAFSPSVKQQMGCVIS